MAKAAQDAGLTIDGTVKSMMDLQQQGGLISSKVLPFFAERMSKAAQANGGLEKAINSNRVAMNRLMTTTQESADTFFKSGFSEGLTDFFNTTADNLRDLLPLFKGLGRIVGSTLHLISRGIDLVTPPLRLLGMLLDNITEATGKLSFALTSIFGVGLYNLISKSGSFTKFLSTMRLGFLAMLAPVMKVVGALMLLEELLNMLVFRDKEGYLFDASIKGTEKEKNMGSAMSATSIFGKNSLTEFLDTPIADHLQSLSKSLGFGSSPSPVKVEGNVYIDGESVGRVIGTTESFKESTGQVLYPILTE